MHFSIPDAQEVKDASAGSTYVAYNLHVNGLFHCSLRYKQLHHLHEQLRREFGTSSSLPATLPPFPPKRLLPLTPAQAEERRLLLEKYIQTVSQDPLVASSQMFAGFLLTAQQETFLRKMGVKGQVGDAGEDDEENWPLDVCLMNGHKVAVRVRTNQATSEVLQKVCQQLKLPREHTHYFALFLMRREDDGDVTLVRRLQDFESPYISQKSLQGIHRIVLRKSYWDPSYDEDLLEDPVALNLLYVQMVADLQHGWILAGNETRQHLVSLQAKGSKKEYLRLARTLKFYGYVQFRPCLCDYPVPNTRVVIAAGNKELNFRIQQDGECKEGSFRVTRMRCWRITVVHGQNEGTEGNRSAKEPWLELSIEYLMAKDTLEWITIASDQAILMSVCLQGMVEELLSKRSGVGLKKTYDRLPSGPWSYMRRDGSTFHVAVARKESVGSDFPSSGSSGTEDGKSPTRESSMKKLTGRLSNMGLKSSSKSSSSDNPMVENDAFEGIQDEDL